MELRDRCFGAIFGIAVGDALGLPFEGWSRRRLKKSPVVDLVNGLWSDDTSLTLCLAASLSEKGFDLDDLGNRFCKWYTDGYMTPFGRVIGIGRTTRLAIERMIKGKKAEDAGSKGEKSNGNGSLMRIIPIPFYFQKEGEKSILEASHKASSITHAHPRAKMACGIYSLVVYYILKGMDKYDAYRFACSYARDYYSSVEEFRKELIHYEKVLSSKISELPEDEIPSSGYVVDTLEASLWCFLRNKSFQDTVLSAVNLGGDTDTIGAVSGGLAGAYYGFPSIPRGWIEKLKNNSLIFNVAEKFCKSLSSKV